MKALIALLIIVGCGCDIDARYPGDVAVSDTVEDAEPYCNPSEWLLRVPKECRE